jgi:DNA modification methylase
MIKFIQGNCVDKIKDLEDNSIDCVISSPPYFGLRDYGMEDQFGLENNYKDYIANTIKVFDSFKPKLKEHASIWWNIGDTYSNHKDCKSIGQTLAKGTSREKAHEIEKGKSHTRNTKSLKESGLKDKDLMMIPNRVAIALQENGWYIRSEIIWHKPNPMPESVRDRPTSCHEKIWLITKNKKYYYDYESIKEPAKDWGTRDRKIGSAFVNATPGRSKQGGGKDCNFAAKGRNKRNVWTITTKPCREAHFATFPMDLIEPCVLAGCKEGGTILDPFGGAGTTGLVAQKHNRNAILIELNPKYIDIAKKRFEKIFGSLL